MRRRRKWIIWVLIGTLSALFAAASNGDEPTTIELNADQSLAEALGWNGEDWLLALDGGVAKPIGQLQLPASGTHQLWVGDAQGVGRWYRLVLSATDSDIERQPNKFLLDLTSPRVEFEFIGPHREGVGSIVIGSQTQIRIHASEELTGQSVSLDGQLTDPARLNGLPAGEHLLEVTARDRAGNQGIAGQVKLTVDAQGPTIDIEYLAEQWNGSIYQSPMSLRFALSDNHSDTLRLQLRQSGEWTDWSVAQLYETKLQQLQARAVDEFGNETIETFVWHFDQVGPEIALTTEAGLSGDRLNVSQGDRVLFLVEDAGSGVARAEYRYNHRPWLPVPQRLRLVDAGTYRVQIRAIDKAGNEAQGHWLIRAERPPRDKR